MIRITNSVTLRSALAVAAAIAATSCAPGGYYRGSQSSLDSLLTGQTQMMRRIDALEKELKATRESVQSTRATTDTRLREVSQRLDVLDGKLEATSDRVKGIAPKLDTLKKQQQERSSADTTRTGTDSGGTLDAEQMYEAAYSDIAAGRYKLAREAFETYLRHFPESEVADNAQYWIGESYYATGEFLQAIAEFNKVVEGYPKGDKVPAALLKIGLSHSRLKNNENAAKTYRLLIQRYPRSPEAASARERLAAKS